MARPPRIRVDDVAFFTTFADCLNFSEAARQLHLSQPALHVKIRKLGEHLGVSLYQRAGGQLRLTSQGELVARFGRELQARSDSLVQRLQTGANDEPVVLAAGTGSYMYLLGPAIQKYLKGSRSPLQLLTQDRDQAIQSVLSGKVHLAVAPAEHLPADIEATDLGKVGQVVVMPRAHPLASRRKLRLRDLQGCALVVPRSGQPHREVLSRLLQSAGVDWTVAVEATGWELMMRFVQLGIGIAIVNAYCQPPRGLVAIPIPELPTLRFQIIHLKAPALSDGALALKQSLLDGTSEWRTA